MGNKKKSNKNRVVLFFTLFVVIVLFLIFSGGIQYYGKDSLYYYGNLSFKNGIDISRWYGQLKEVDPLITRILFNKLLYPVIFIYKYLTILFQGFIEL